LDRRLNIALIGHGYLEKRYYTTLSKMKFFEKDAVYRKKIKRFEKFFEKNFKKSI